MNKYKAFTQTFKFLGSIYYSLILSVKRLKLDEKMIKGVLVKYAISAKYISYDLETKQVIFSKDVTFDESSH